MSCVSRPSFNRNYSEKLIINQAIIQGENRINFLVNRYPQRVERMSADFYDLNIHPLSVGVPSQLLQNRPDIRQAERELAAAGLDVKVARVNFFPQLVINGGVGLQSLLINHLFEPQAVLGDIAGGLVGPLVNKRAIRAQYLTANARQLQAIYNYQRVILEAFTQVINRVTMVENYSQSIEIKKQQLATLERAAVAIAERSFSECPCWIDYLDVLVAQQALRDARVALIDTKTEQLAAIVNDLSSPRRRRGDDFNSGRLSRSISRTSHTVRGGENFRTISLLYYRSSRYCKALWAANQKAVPDFDRLPAGSKILIPRLDQLDPALFEEPPAPALAPPRWDPDPVANRRCSPPCPRPRHLPRTRPARSAMREPRTPSSRTPTSPPPPRPRRSRRRPEVTALPRIDP